MVEEAKVHVENWTALENTDKIHLMVKKDKIPVEIRSPHYQKMVKLLRKPSLYSSQLIHC
jgi:hypothetical protein